MNEPDVIRHMLSAQTIAVVGLSEDPAKPSHYVSRYMQAAGKRILPVNPSIQNALGETAYPSLSALPTRPDLVNVFRLPHAVPAIVEEMIALRLNQIWVQQGIVHRDAALYAEAHGIAVVMDRCIMVEHRVQRPSPRRM